MKSYDTISTLESLIEQINQINSPLYDKVEGKASELEEKESLILTKIVECFHEILSDKFNLNKQTKEEESKAKDYKSSYWSFISKHFNTPVTQFCKMFEKNESNENNSDNLFEQKEKNWIYFSILEYSLSESILEIYRQNLHEKYYDNDAIIITKKNAIIKILNDLKSIKFINIMSQDFCQYVDFMKNKTNTKKLLYSENSSENEGQSNTPKKTISSEKPNKKANDDTFNFLFISSIPFKSDYLPQDEVEDFFQSKNQFDINLNFQGNNQEDNEENFTCSQKADFSPSIVDNFYNFQIKKENDKKEEEQGNILDKEEEFNSSKQQIKHKSSGLILNPKKYTHLPSDTLYEINKKTVAREYNNNDKLVYKKKKRPISNCLLLYLNNFYKKAPYHKFFKHNLHSRPISLKEQNYQCYICRKSISLFFGIPIESVFWCSYYMRYVCKNCIDDEYSIIPYFVLDKWCFDKFSISKKAKKTLMQWYTKPVIYIKKDDKLLKKIPQLNKVIEIKKVINNIFDKMKCENKFKFVEKNLEEYSYLAIKEYIFSMRDLVEINNKQFYKRLKEFKNKFVQHISGECPVCKFEGEKCNKCGYDEKIFFYDIENVVYCKVCNKSFHKKCIGLVGHVH